MLVICDIDGTIANITHRLHYIQNGNKKWDEFYDACDKDIEIEDITRILDLLLRRWEVDPNQVIYVSGRRESTREKTSAWLKRHHLPEGPIFMRPDNDYREDFILKKEILREIERLYMGQEILCVLDDRDQVVKMWRKEGLTCLQVKNGDY